MFFANRCHYVLTPTNVDRGNISCPKEDLTRLSKRFRKQAGKKRAQAAPEMGVAQTSVFQAEEKPAQALFKLRSRIIEKYSGFKVVGPVYLVRPK